MLEEDYRELLHRVVTHNKHVFHGENIDNAVNLMINWMYCHGGDSTYLLICHYKEEELKRLIREEVNLSC